MVTSRGGAEHEGAGRDRLCALYVGHYLGDLSALFCVAVRCWHGSHGVRLCVHGRIKNFSKPLDKLSAL